MWTATEHLGADLSKTFSKKSLEIVLEAEILAPLGFSDFGKDKAPKALDFTGLSAFYIVFYIRLFCVNVGFVKKSWKPFGQKPRGFESHSLRQYEKTTLAVVFCIRTGVLWLGAVTVVTGFVTPDLQRKVGIPLPKAFWA